MQCDKTPGTNDKLKGVDAVRILGDYDELKPPLIPFTGRGAHLLTPTSSLCTQKVCLFAMTRAQPFRTSTPNPRAPRNATHTRCLLCVPPAASTPLKFLPGRSSPISCYPRLSLSPKPPFPPLVSSRHKRFLRRCCSTVTCGDFVSSCRRLGRRCRFGVTVAAVFFFGTVTFAWR